MPADLLDALPALWSGLAPDQAIMKHGIWYPDQCHLLEPGLLARNVPGFLSLISLVGSVPVQAKMLKVKSQQAIIEHLCPCCRLSDTSPFEYFTR